LGGVLALLLSLFMYRLGAAFPIQWLGASIAGLVEEPAKLLTLVIVINNPRYRYTLNGLLLGAAVGTGFAAFESAGYGLSAGLEAGSLVMRDVIRDGGRCAVAGEAGCAIQMEHAARVAIRARVRRGDRVAHDLGLELRVAG
jgi:RsiW-degrading membrane proteinase PrsW (M82 family)